MAQQRTAMCGNRAAASAYAAHQELERPWSMMTVLPGGLLAFEPGDAGVLWMRGPARGLYGDVVTLGASCKPSFSMILRAQAERSLALLLSLCEECLL